MKRFMMFSVSIMCLSIAVLIGFYVGSQRVEAQAPGDAQYFYAYDGGRHIITAILPNGDIYYNKHIEGPFTEESRSPGNFWTGIVASEQSSWGNIKNLKK